MPNRLRLWAWRAAALVPAFVVASFVANSSVPPGIRMEVVAVIVATLFRPVYGLMLVAFLAPLGDIVAPFLGAPPTRHAETLLVTFLACRLSYLGRADESTPALPVSLVTAMWIFSGVLIASVVATGVQLQRESPAQLQRALELLAASYLLTDDPIGAHAALMLIEGLGVMAAAASIARIPRDRFLVRMSLIAAGVAAAVASGLLGLRIAPARTLARHAFNGTRRYSAIVGDVNATGSVYLIFLGLAAGVTTGVRRARPWRIATGIILAGLAITQSAAALLAGALVLSVGTLLWIAARGSRRSKIVIGLLLVPLIAGAIVFSQTRRATGSLEMRAGFNLASRRFIETRPVWGIGVAQYYPLSKVTLPPRLAWLYDRENAHDYYLQTAAEVGLVGLAAFVWLLAAALVRPIARIWSRRADGVMVACVGGVAAYLITALTGHPFLVPETAIPLWIVLGLLAAHDPAARSARSRWVVGAAIGVACALVIAAPLRAGAVRVRLQPGEDGFGPLQVDSMARPYREAGSFASLFIGPTTTAVEIPMRLGASGRASAAIVGVSVHGLFGQQVPVTREWSTVTVPLPGAEALMPYQRINLAVTRPEGMAPPGMAGVDIGQVRLLSVK